MLNTSYKLKSLKTLLIDDDPFVRNSMELAFAQKGYPLRIAKSAEEGLHTVGQEAFDIIVSDYRLPGMNGLEFFSQIVSRTPKTIKVLISASGNHDDIAAAYSIGINDYLPKPFTLDAFWATLIMHSERHLTSSQRVIEWRYRDRMPHAGGRSSAGNLYPNRSVPGSGLKAHGL